MRRWCTRLLSVLVPLLLAWWLLAAPVSAESLRTGPSFATWNTQGGGVGKWGAGMVRLATDYDVVALQEAGALSTFKTFVDAARRCTTSHVPDPENAPHNLDMLDCDWQYPDPDDPARPPRVLTRKLFFAVTGWTANDTNTRSLAFIVNTSTVSLASPNTFAYLPPVKTADRDEGDRGLLRLTLTGGEHVYSAHADAIPLARNVMSLVNKARADSAGTWVILGDFNIDPKYFRPQLGASPPPLLVTSGEKTHKTHEYDYMVYYSASPSPFTATRHGAKYGSDHNPVIFRQ